MKNNRSKTHLSGIELNRTITTEKLQQPVSVSAGITAASLWDIQKSYRTVYGRRR